MSDEQEINQDLSMEEPTENLQTSEDGVVETPQTDNNTLSWETSPHYKEYGGDVNKLYENFHKNNQEYEKHKPWQEKINNWKFENPEQIDQLINHYQQLYAHNNYYQQEYNPMIEKLTKIAEHPQYGAQFTKLIEEYHKDNLLSQLPPEYRTLPEQFQKEMAEFRQDKQQREQERVRQEWTQKTDTQINNSTKQIEEFANEYGIEFGKKEYNDFMNYCQQKNINPEYMKHEFIQLAIPYIVKSTQIKASEATLKNINQNKIAGTIPRSGKPTNSTQTKASMKDKVGNVLAKYGIN